MCSRSIPLHANETGPLDDEREIIIRTKNCGGVLVSNYWTLRRGALAGTPEKVYKRFESEIRESGRTKCVSAIL